ncbi:glycosyl hydrolases family 18-domain-containing protein [Coniochaeta sp. 2T2.1]|nr:glycosyl hydrolases family 18-domain-containing protein [Coniochaeta sp. 2T2.1]
MSILGGTLTNSVAAPKVTDCSGGQQCTLGCCYIGGYCGYGPDFCGSKACIPKLSANQTCAQLSECDAGGYPGALWGPTYAKTTNCPLNVCCSKFGFSWPQPSCGGSSATARNIGYYEGWNQDHPCDPYTHLNFAFAFIDPVSYAVVPMAENQKSLYKRFTGLKAKKPDLQTWISIGGWSFNDPNPTQTTFSQLAASASAQKAFFSSVLNFLKEYDFDGVDLDWEYPDAKDRGGVPEDFKNFAIFLSRMRSALGSYGLSITLPSSYWYLQHFDIVNLVKHVDFLSIMTYDVYGTWDSTIGEIGPYVYAHTNITVVDKGVQLLWHNNIDPAKVNFGFGFYGRSYTLSNPSCEATGCEFSKGGNPGKCTGTEGILSYAEVVSVLQDKAINAEVRLDSKEMVKIATWKDQWIGYDDAETIKMKMDYANKHCLGG